MKNRALILKAHSNAYTVMDKYTIQHSMSTIIKISDVTIHRNYGANMDRGRDRTHLRRFIDNFVHHRGRNGQLRLLVPTKI